MSDNGDGVGKELEERLFERFIHDGEAPLTAGSVGLGLAIANELVNRMGGKITYARSRGTTAFWVELPLEKSPVAVPAPA